MARDTRWRIGETIVDGLLSGQPSWSVGDSTEVEFYVGDESVRGRVSPERGLEATYGGLLPATAGGEFPACYGSPILPTAIGARPREDVYHTASETPYGELRDLIRYSGSATVELSIDHTPMIRETVPPRADLDSFVFDIEPLGDSKTWTNGAWVLVTEAEDISVVPDIDAWLAVSVNCTVLAPLHEYDTREELFDDMAPPITPDIDVDEEES